MATMATTATTTTGTSESQLMDALKAKNIVVLDSYENMPKSYIGADNLRYMTPDTFTAFQEEYNALSPSMKNNWLYGPGTEPTSVGKYAKGAPIGDVSSKPSGMIDFTSTTAPKTILNEPGAFKIPQLADTMPALANPVQQQPVAASNGVGTAPLDGPPKSALQTGDIFGTATSKTTGVASVDAAAQKANLEKLGGKINTGLAIGQAVTDTVGAIAETKKNLAVNEYIYDVNYWKSQGKDWFDPKVDSAPTFEEYMPNMPSANDALKEGSLTGHPVAESAIGGAVSMGITGATIGTMAGPVGTLIGGGIGALVGGVTGYIQGIMTWNSAKDMDAKNKQRAYDEYTTKLKQWTLQKNAQNEVRRKEAIALEYKMREIGETKKKEEKQEKNESRAKIMAAIMNLGGFSAQKKAQRAGKWSPKKAYTLKDVLSQAG